MTYLSFHLIFTLPPILGLTIILLVRKRGEALRSISKSIATIAAIAVIYTTPWDNYLVFKGIWSYGPERVMATLGFVPVEEYAFFVLQTILTGLLLLMMRIWVGSSPGAGKIPQKRAIALALALTGGFGLLCLFGETTLYLGLILAWSAPVMLAQWVLGAEVITKAMPYWFPTVLLSTVYLAVADKIAISAETWSISESFTIGLHVFGLPVEEALFFFVTNVMVVWGVLLFERYMGRSKERSQDSAGIVH